MAFGSRRAKCSDKPGNHAPSTDVAFRLNLAPQLGRVVAAFGPSSFKVGAEVIHSGRLARSGNCPERWKRATVLRPILKVCAIALLFIPWRCKTIT